MDGARQMNNFFVREWVSVYKYVFNPVFERILYYDLFYPYCHGWARLFRNNGDFLTKRKFTVYQREKRDRRSLESQLTLQFRMNDNGGSTKWETKDEIRGFKDKIETICIAQE